MNNDNNNNYFFEHKVELSHQRLEQAKWDASVNIELGKTSLNASVEQVRLVQEVVKYQMEAVQQIKKILIVSTIWQFEFI